MAKTKGPKVWKYHASMSWTDPDSGTRINILTQLYECSGLYVATYEGSRCVSQGGMTPQAFARAQSKTVKELTDKGIEVSLGREKRATTDERGFYKELQPGE